MKNNGERRATTTTTKTFKNNPKQKSPLAETSVQLCVLYAAVNLLVVETKDATLVKA